MLTVQARNEQARRWIGWSVAVALAMVASQVPFAGFIADDFAHRAMLQGSVPRPGPVWDLYRFFSGKPEDLRAALDAGLAPWFVDPQIKLAFFRPLSSLALLVEHRLFGDWALGHLLYGGAWYALLCGLVALLYQQLLPGRTGGLAGVLFAALGAHHQTVGWFSAHNALLAGTFAVLGVLAHLGWRERGSRRSLTLSLLAVTLSLAAGEVGLGGVALILAYELARTEVPLGERLRAASPALGITAFYFAAYVALGYGTRASGAYINPLQEPLTYLSELPLRLSASLSTLLIGAPADAWFFAPRLRWVLAGAGIGAAVALGTWLRASLVGAGRRQRRMSVWLLLGIPLTLLPQMAGLLGPRSYLMASVPAVPLLSMLIGHGFSHNRTLLRRLAGKAGALILLVLHGALGVGSWVASGAFFASVRQATGDRARALLLDRPEVEDEDLVLISVPDVFVGVYLPFERRSRSEPVPRRWRLLSLAECDHLVTRTGDSTIELELTGAFLETAFEGVYRRPSHPLRVDHRVQIDGLSVRVLGVDSRGRANHFRMDFDRSLDDGRLRLYGWDGGEMRPVRLARGEARRLEWQRPF